MKKIAICGVGNFGYAILKHLDKKNSGQYELHAYDRNKALISHLSEKRSHLFFHSGIKVGKKICFHSNIQDLAKNADLLILAVVSDAIREVLEKIKPHINNNIIIIGTAKALDSKTGKRLSEVVKEVFSNDFKYKFDYAFLAGGTIASDLFKHQPLGVNIASENASILEDLVNMFVSNNLYVEPTTDLIGVEYASAMKNVIAILAGIIRGLDFSYGSETYIISRVAREIEEIILENFGGKKKTFSIGSQCWGNDMWMSCTGNTRNKQFGILLGKGNSIMEAKKIMEKENKTVEGIYTIGILKKIIDVSKYPFLNFLCELFDGKVKAEELINVNRPL